MTAPDDPSGGPSVAAPAPPKDRKKVWRAENRRVTLDRARKLLAKLASNPKIPGEERVAAAVALVESFPKDPDPDGGGGTTAPTPSPWMRSKTERTGTTG